jgi:GntR family transcriptional regulator, transcriptional repressor for pyruvate dehydrogenase complex
MAQPKPRAYQSVLQRVEADLSAGRLSIGDRLPGERVLADQLGVSRASVREALRILDALGVVRSAAGSGPDAGAVVIANPSAGLTSALRLHLASSHLLVDDIVGTRVLLETWAVRETATAADASDLQRAQELLIRMDDAGIGPAEFHRLDADFHLELTALAGNALITAIMASLRGSIEGYVLAAVQRLPDWPAMARRLRREHHNILAAARAGAADRAAVLLRRHIEGFHRSTQG